MLEEGGGGMGGYFILPPGSFSEILWIRQVFWRELYSRSSPLVRVQSQFARYFANMSTSSDNFDLAHVWRPH